MMKKRHLIPLALFLALASTLAVGLQRGGATQEIPSPLIGKPVPAFSLNQVAEGQEPLTPQALRGQVWVFNAWASWCTSCRAEHPLLVELAKNSDVVLVGLNYQDQRPAAQKWLTRYGDPFRYTVLDLDGRLGMNLGLVGVPETFVIDKKGIIRRKFAGPLTAQQIQTELLPLIKELQGA